MIEVAGGVVTNIVATEEISIYLIDHDKIKERLEFEKCLEMEGKADDPLKDEKQAQQPDLITRGDEEWFQDELKNTLDGYEDKELS